MHNSHRKRRQSGQSLVEYLVVTVFVFLVTLLPVALFLDGVADFYKNVMSVICLPLP